MNLCILFGRPFKPVALGIGYSLLVLFGFAALDLGLLGGSWQSDIMGGAALVGFGLLAAGWIAKQQALVEYGLAVAGWVWGARLLLALMLNGPLVEGVWLSAAWAIIATGSFYLERRDRTLGYGRPRH